MGGVYMIDLKLDASGDLEFDRDLVLVSNIDEIKQELEIILKTNQGEFFGDTTMGLNQSEIFVKNPDLVLIANYVMQALQQQENVINAEVTSIELKNRQLFVKFNVTLNVGETISSEVVLSLIVMAFQDQHMQS